MNVFNVILQGSEATEKKAYDFAQSFDFVLAVLKLTPNNPLTVL